MRFITDQEVEQIIFADPDEYFAYLEQRIALISDPHNKQDWAEIKPKIIYDDPNHHHGDVRPMTCFTDKVKIVKVISTNPHRKKHYSVSVGATLLLDYEENFPICIFDAPAISGIRTAAMALWAAKHTNDKFSRGSKILLIGVGRVGGYFVRLADKVIPENHLDPYDPEFSHPLRSFHGYDIVVTATDSKVPFIKPTNCDAHLVISVGADTHFNHELTHSFLHQRSVGGHIYVDIPEAEEVGDLEFSGIPCDGTMFTAMVEQDARVFISVGSALMDALTVEFLYERLDS